jgi:hypothetical protein
MTKLTLCFLSTALCGSTLAAEFSGHVAMLQDGKSIPVTNALVRVISPIPSAPAERPKPVVKLNGNTLTPQVLVVLTNEEFTIENAGGNLYNLHLNFRQNREVNTAVRPGPGFVSHRRAEKPELFARIGEDLNQVHGYICVVENPYYSVTGQKGSFSFELPAGTYSLEAVHPRFGKLRKEMTIPDASTSAEFLLVK